VMNLSNQSRLFGRVFNTPLLIDQPKLEVILDVLGPKLEGAKLARIDGETASRRSFSMAGNIAVIPVIGTTVRRSNGADAMSGMVSYQSLQAQLYAALADPAVEGILLEVDSGGGEASGCFELVEHIYAARQQKPVWAIANDYAASAGYAIASAAERLYANAFMGLVGSIGVVITHLDRSIKNEKEGLVYTFITAGENKAEGNPHETLSDNARSFMQQRVRQTYGIFVDAVARNRHLKPQDIMDTEASIYSAEDALKIGLIDAIGNFDQVLSDFRKHLATPNSLSNKEINHMNTKTSSVEAAETLENTATQEPESKAAALSETAVKPEAAAAPSDDGVALAHIERDAVESERMRVKGIYTAAAKLGIAESHATKLVDSAVPLAKAQASLIDFAAQHSPTQTIQNQQPLSDSTFAEDDSLPLEERAEQTWKNDASIRKEFGSLSVYTAYRKGEDEGSFKVFGGKAS